jgi:hypothetical protein
VHAGAADTRRSRIWCSNPGDQIGDAVPLLTESSEHLWGRACSLRWLGVGEEGRMTSYEERLEAVPSHPEQAASYPELLALWKALRAREDPDPAQLAEWDQLVLGLLTVDERGYYLDEKRLAGATVAAGKVNRLAGILLGRHNPPAGFSSRSKPPSEAQAAQPAEDAAQGAEDESHGAEDAPQGTEDAVPGAEDGPHEP